MPRLPNRSWVVCIVVVLLYTSRSFGEVNQDALATVLQAMDDNLSRLQSFHAVMREKVTNSAAVIDELRHAKKNRVSHGQKSDGVGLFLNYVEDFSASVEVWRDASRIRYTYKLPQLETYTLLDMNGDVTSYVPGEYAATAPFKGPLSRYALKYSDPYGFGAPPTSSRSLAEFLRSADADRAEFANRNGVAGVIVNGALDPRSKVEVWFSSENGFLPTEVATTWNADGHYNFYATIEYDLIEDGASPTRFPKRVLCRRPSAEDKFTTLGDSRWELADIGRTTIEVTSFETNPLITSEIFVLPEYKEGTDIRNAQFTGDVKNSDLTASGSRKWNTILIVNILIVIVLVFAVAARRLFTR